MLDVHGARALAIERGAEIVRYDLEHDRREVLFSVAAVR
jgi:hypothetical protein